MWRDFRFAARGLLKRGGFTAVVLLTLGLGIGANTAIFSVVHGVVLRSLPYRAAERIVSVGTMDHREGTSSGVAYLDYLELSERGELFEEFAAYDDEDFDLIGEGDPERVPGLEVTAGFFEVFGATPILGRRFDAQDYRQAGDTVVVLSAGLWRRRFGGARDVVGKTIHFADRTRTVVGVIDERSAWPTWAELWVPMTFRNPIPSWMMSRDSTFLRAVARWRAGVELSSARSELRAMARRIAEELPAARGNTEFFLTPLKDVIVGGRLRLALWVLLSAVGFVLLAACINVANLSLARAVEQEREVSARIALGASRFQVVRPLLAESFLLAFGGGLAGILVSYWGVQIILRVAPDDIPRLNEVSLSNEVLLFTLVVTLVTAIVSGVIPARHVSRTDLGLSLKESGGSTTHARASQRARQLLVVSEVAFSMLLLVGAGLMIRSFFLLTRNEPGLARVEDLLSLQLELPGERYREKENANAFLRQLIERIERLPGVTEATAASAIPLGGGGISEGRFHVREGQPQPPAGPGYFGEWNYVVPGYFRTLGIELARGRTFTHRDDAQAPPVAIINMVMARQMFGDEDPVGKRIRAWQEEESYREIVGVVENVRLYGLHEPFEPVVYVPDAQVDWRPVRALIVRSSLDVESLVSAIRAEARSLDPLLPLDNPRTLDDVLSDTIAAERFSAFLLGAFAAVALILSAIGIYGVMSYDVAQRRKEIGIRLALGASRPSILRGVVGRGFVLSLVGIGVGVSLSLVGGRALRTLLYEIRPEDPVTYGLVCVLFLMTAALATWIPASRATRIDALRMLREE